MKIDNQQEIEKEMWDILRGKNIVEFLKETMEFNISFDVRYDEVSKDRLIILNCILDEGVGSKLQKFIREEL